MHPLPRRLRASAAATSRLWFSVCFTWGSSRVPIRKPRAAQKTERRKKKIALARSAEEPLRRGGLPSPHKLRNGSTGAETRTQWRPPAPQPYCNKLSPPKKIAPRGGALRRPLRPEAPPSPPWRRSALTGADTRTPWHPRPYLLARKRSSLERKPPRRGSQSALFRRAGLKRPPEEPFPLWHAPLPTSTSRSTLPKTHDASSVYDFIAISY